MALMLDILALKRPEEWTICNYTCKTYEIFNVPEGTKEYDDIVQEFRNKIGSNYKITELKRIQHPYLYGIYLINRERCIRFGTPSMVSLYLFLVLFLVCTHLSFVLFFRRHAPSKGQ